MNREEWEIINRKRLGELFDPETFKQVDQYLEAMGFWILPEFVRQSIITITEDEFKANRKLYVKEDGTLEQFQFSMLFARVLCAYFTSLLNEKGINE